MNEKETSRLEAFSDGVFAVAITLLILNLKLPAGLLSDGDLWRALRDEWPAFLAYVISFLTIGVMWLNHHRLFIHIRRIDTALLFINLFLLLIIVFIPFPTALLAEYISLPTQHAAALFYTGTCLLMACGFNGLWFYASYNHRLLAPNVDGEQVREISIQYLFGPLMYLIIFISAWFSMTASLILIFVLMLFFAVPSRVVSRLFFRRTISLVQPASADQELEESEL